MAKKIIADVCTRCGICITECPNEGIDEAGNGDVVRHGWQFLGGTNTPNPGLSASFVIELKEGDPDSDEAWHMIRNTTGVTGFVSSGTRPVPLSHDEVSHILRAMRMEQPRMRVAFIPGQSVRIVDGPFEDFVGTVDEINTEKGRVKVVVNMFGRETPVELDFLQVEKL